MLTTPERQTSHSRADIAGPVLWHTVRDHRIGHDLNDAQAVDPAGDPDRQTLAGELIDQGHQPDFPAIMGLGFDKVVGPDMIAVLRPQPDARPVIEP